MTNEEAIDNLNTIEVIFDAPDLAEAIDLAIEALQKQVPVKPIEKDLDYLCPICGNGVGMEYCICGQRIDWSDEE